MNKTNQFISKEFIAKFLPQNPIIIEAGAHIGRDTVKMAKIWPNGKIYAFEPVPKLYSELVLRTKEYKNIKCHQIALSNKVGKSEMYISSGRSTALSSLLKPVGGLATHPKTKFDMQEIQTDTLDNWAKNNPIKEIDFLWLDTQGTELEILRSSSIFKTAKAILIETSLEERYEKAPSYLEVKNWLISQNFKPIKESSPKHSKIDILFIKNK